MKTLFRKLVCIAVILAFTLASTGCASRRMYKLAKLGAGEARKTAMSASAARKLAKAEKKRAKEDEKRAQNESPEGTAPQ